MAVAVALHISPAPAVAQWLSVGITPEYASHSVGTWVDVTITVCAYDGTFSYQPQTTVYFNGADVTSEFEYEAVIYEPCANGGATDGFILTGSYTTINGPNTLRFVYATNIESGDITAPNYATYAGLVTPDDSTAASQAAFTSGYTKTFVVKNWGTNSDTYKLRCVGSGSIVCDSTNVTSVALSSGSSSNITAYYGVNAAGTGKLYLGAYGNGVSDTGSINITASSQTAGAPRIDPTVYNYDKQSVAACAQACFAATHAQSAVPYFSLSTPRTVTLAYNGDRLNPKPFIHLDVNRDAGHGTRPAQWRLQAKVKGSLVTFVNGEQTLKFDTVHVDGYYQRIGGQFDASSYATGAYPMEIIVSAYYSAGGGSLITTVYTTKLVVVNETNSLIAKGWKLGGLQRWYRQTDGSALITEGDGSAVYFPYTMTVNWYQYGSPLASPAGEFSRLAYLQSPELAWTRLYIDGTKVAFDTLGRMTSVQDRSANTVTIVYKNATTDTVWKVKDPLDTTTTLSYGANGLASIAAKGRTTTITVNGSRLLTAIKDPDNDSTRFAYDGSSRLTTVTDRRGNATTITYDDLGKIDSVTAPSVTVIKASGGDTTLAPAVNLTAWQRYGVPVPTAATSSTPWAAVRADTVKSTVREPGGAVTRFTVNRWGAAVQITAPLGYVAAVLYDGNGLPIRTIAPAGAVDSFAYNADGLATFARSAPDSGVYAYYTGRDQPDSTKGHQRPTIRNVFDVYGRITTSIRAGDTTKFTYDSRGRIETVTDPLNHLLRRIWYSTTNGNSIKDSVPGGRVTLRYYDAYGRDSALKAPGFATKRTIYDIVNRPVLAYDGVNGAPDSIFYNPLLPDSVKLKGGLKYSAVYNALGWAIRRTDPVGKSDTLGYSPDGDLRRWVNRRGQATTYTYDSLHRPLKVTGANTPTDSIVYSSYGQVMAATDSFSVETAFFGLHGRPDSVKTEIAGNIYKRRYRYNANGSLDSLRVTAWAHYVFTHRRYGYHSTTFALDTITLGTSSTEYTRNNDLAVTGLALPGTASIAYQFTPTHSLATSRATASYADSVNRYAGYDKAQRLSRHVLANRNNGNGFRYDSLGQLIADTTVVYSGSNPCSVSPPVVDEEGSACATDGSWTAPSVTTFSYDPAGNRTDLSGSHGPGNRIRVFDSCNYVTDSLADGNVVRRSCGADTVRFHWTAESRLRALKVVGGDSLEMAYDGAGRLIRRSVNGTVGYFIWDGANLLAELGANGANLAEYSYYGVDELHALITGQYKYFAHHDMIGNVIALADSNQSLARTYRYKRWGESNGGTDIAGFSGVDRARFKGALWMGPQLDIYYMRARWYEPKSGRFLSEDPIGLAGGANLYAFASNDPVNGADPTGLDDDPVCWDSGTPANPGVTCEDRPRPTTPQNCPQCTQPGGGGGVQPNGPGSGNNGTPQICVAGVCRDINPQRPQEPPKKPQQCPNVSFTEWSAGQAALGRSSQSGTEEGYIIYPGGRMVAVGLETGAVLLPRRIVFLGTRYGGTITSFGPPPGSTFVHSHPNGAGLSFEDTQAGDRFGVRVVSAARGMYGAHTPGVDLRDEPDCTL